MQHQDINEIIQRSSELSCLVYEQPHIINNKLPTDLTDFQFIEERETDTQALFCVDENIVHINIRGTEFDNIEDWFTNLDCKLVTTHGMNGKYHRGFLKDALSIYDKIMKAMTPYYISGHRFCIGGHSQGAAVGKILYAMNAKVIDYCVGIGEPRSMDGDAALNLSQYSHKIFSIVNNNDIVTRVPPRAMGFHHTPRTLWYFDHDGNLHHDMSWWDGFKDRISGRIDHLFKIGTDGISDHDRYGYVDLVNLV